MKRLEQRSSGQLGAMPWRIVGWNLTGPQRRSEQCSESTTFMHWQYHLVHMRQEMAHIWKANNSTDLVEFWKYSGDSECCTLYREKIMNGVHCAGLEESWTMPKIQLGAPPSTAPLWEIEGLVWPASSGHKKQGKVSVSTKCKSTVSCVLGILHVTVSCVLGIALVTALINCDQWEAAIGWLLLAKYGGGAVKKTFVWTRTIAKKCWRGDEMCTFASGGFSRIALLYFCLVTAKNSAIVHKAMLLFFFISIITPQ